MNNRSRKRQLKRPTYMEFSEYVYDVNFDRNGFESITSKKRRPFIDTDTVSMILTIINNVIRTKLLDETV